MDAAIRPEKAFEYPILAKKSVTVSVKTFFFLEITCFWAEKAFEFPILAKNPSQFSDKPCDSDSRTIKIRVKVVCSFLTLSKSPLFFQILATRLNKRVTIVVKACHRSVGYRLMN